MKQHILDIIRIGRDDGAIQVSFSNGAVNAFIDFDQDHQCQCHYIGDTPVSFEDALNHLEENIDHIKGIA